MWPDNILQVTGYDIDISYQIVAIVITRDIQ